MDVAFDLLYTLAIEQQASLWLSPAEAGKAVEEMLSNIVVGHLEALSNAHEEMLRTSGRQSLFWDLNADARLHQESVAEAWMQETGPPAERVK